METAGRIVLKSSNERDSHVETAEKVGWQKLNEWPSKAHTFIKQSLLEVVTEIEALFEEI